ncbi:MAG: helix-turn-helix transcriptional regulator [Chloroflexota bacterium]|nr:helix-turn-helix transcriptional regulator [Chloroflexota bacterium]
MTDTIITEAPSSIDQGERPRRRGRRSLAELRAARGGLATKPVKPSAEKVVANSLGSRVRLARKRLGLSQQELAGPQYVASYISAIERDKIHPSLKALELIAKRLGEPVEYFLYGGYGSGALQDNNSEIQVDGRSNAAPETSFTNAMRDKLLEAQLIVERAAHLAGAKEQHEMAEAEQMLNAIPRHQLSEYDRAQLGRLLGVFYLRSQDTEQARTELEEAQSLAAKTGQTSLEVEIRYMLGNVLFTRRLADQALPYHQTCRETIEANPELFTPELKLSILTGLANDHLALNHNNQAVEIFQEALKTEEETEKPETRANSFFQLANYYRERGDLMRSRAYGQISLSLYEQLNQRRQVLRLSASVGELLAGMGQVGEAEKVLTRAVHVGQAENTLSGTDLALTYTSLAALRLQQGQLDEAGSISRRAIEEARQAGDQLAEGKALQLSAEVETRLEHREDARKLYQDAIAILEQVNMPYVLGDVYKAYGEALEKWGDFANAVGFLKKAYESKR